jgi:hypothetical protein
MKSAKQFLMYFFTILINFTFSISHAQEFHGDISTPVYKGGLPALKEFIKQNIHDPAEPDTSGNPAVVTISYKITEKGKIEAVKILRGISAEYDSEAVRVAKLINDWQPAMQFGMPISVKVIMPVEFKSCNINQNEKEITVNGNVTDGSTGKPVAGCLILEKGTHHGGISDKNGYYSLTIPKEESELEFSSVGYESKTEKIGKNRIINVELPVQNLVIDFDSNRFK